MLTSLRSAARRRLASFGHGPLSSLIFRNFKRPEQTPCAVTVHLLVSSRTWHAGLLAACSLEHHTCRRWNFFVHEDGTVDDAARNAIRDVFPDARLVSRQESDALAGKNLGNHPLCLHQRSKHNLFLKFSDFAAFAPGERFIILDSDVIFFRPPDEILAWVDSGDTACLHNEDTKEKYCIPRDAIEKTMGTVILPRFNSGLVLMPRGAVDFDLAERFLRAFESTAHHPQFFEQTLYGLMASTGGRGRSLPPTYEISWGYFRRPGAVCRHYVGEFKHDLLYIEGAPVLLASVLKKRLR